MHIPKRPGSPRRSPVHGHPARCVRRRRTSFLRWGLVTLSTTSVEAAIEPDDVYPKKVGEVTVTAESKDIHLTPTAEPNSRAEFRRAGVKVDGVDLDSGQTLVLEVWATSYFKTPQTLQLVASDVNASGEGGRDFQIVTVKPVSDLPPPPPPVDLDPQQIALSVTGPEGLCVLPAPFAELLLGVPGHPVAAVAGQEGVSLCDLKDGAEVDFLSMGPLWNVLAVWNPAHEIGALAAVGPDGIRITHYDATLEAFETPTTYRTGENCTDISPTGPSGITNECVVVNNTTNELLQIEADPDTGHYALTLKALREVFFPDANAKVVSAHRVVAGGPILFLTDGDALFQISGFDATEPAVRIGNAGSGVGRVRACGAWAFSTSFGPGTGLGFGGRGFLTDLDGDGSYAFEFGLSTSEGVLGLDCRQNQNGNIEVVTPNFNFAKFNITEIEAGTGDLIRDEVLDTPVGRDNPGFAAWIQQDWICLSIHDENEIVTLQTKQP